MGADLARGGELPLVLYTALGGAEANDPIFAGVLAKPVKQSQLFDMLVSVLTDVDTDDVEIEAAGDQPSHLRWQGRVERRRVGASEGEFDQAHVLGYPANVRSFDFVLSGHDGSRLLLL